MTAFSQKRTLLFGQAGLAQAFDEVIEIALVG